jgi:hypothetical protein
LVFKEKPQKNIKRHKTNKKAQKPELRLLFVIFAAADEFGTVFAK